MEQQQYIAKTFFGLEEILAEELRQIGASDIEVIKRAVAFKGNLEVMYRANLQLRTALRILKVIRKFRAHNERILYKEISKTNWAKLMDVDQTLAVDCAANSDIFRHSKYASLLVKDAIVDQFRKKFRSRPSVNVEYPDLRINLHIFRDECTLSLDSSWASLHKRGYRLSVDTAPLNEVLAAGMIMLTGWKGERPFFDPMCGSGTILIEAAMIATNTAPNLMIKRFGFQRWEDYNPLLWKKILKEAEQNKVSTDVKIIGRDISQTPISLSKENVMQAGFADLIQLERGDFEDSTPPVEGGVIVTNPPYGERLDPGDMVDFYQGIGDTLKNNYSGYDAWIIGSDMDALKHLGLRASKKITLYNGPIECKYLKYEMYKGSKKAKYNQTSEGEEE